MNITKNKKSKTLTIQMSELQAKRILKALQGYESQGLGFDENLRALSDALADNTD